MESCCIFCGGTEPATTKEHCPPRALFQFKAWPEGFEFPACDSCNGGTSDDDALVALLGRLDPFKSQGDKDGRMSGLLRNAKNQHPGLLSQMLSMTAIEARKAARALGIKPPSGMTYQQTGIVKVTEHMDKAVRTLAGKLSKSIFFLETGNVFPAEGSILFHWFTNADLYRYGTPPGLEAFANIESRVPRIVRNRQDLTDQFDYRYSLSAANDLAVLKAVFGKAFGFITAASTIPGLLQQITTNLQSQTGKENGPFTFI